MSADVENIRRDINQTRAAIDHKVGLLESKVRHAKSAVSEALDFRHQVSRRPWALVGLAVATGFAAGLLITDERRAAMSRALTSTEESARRANRGMGRQDLVNTVMVAAGAALADVALEVVRDSFPSVGEYLDKLWSEQGITATSAASALLGRG